MIDESASVSQVGEYLGGGDMLSVSAGVCVLNSERIPFDSLRQRMLKTDALRGKRGTVVLWR